MNQPHTQRAIEAMAVAFLADNCIEPFDDPRSPVAIAEAFGFRATIGVELSSAADSEPQNEV